MKTIRLLFIPVLFFLMSSELYAQGRHRNTHRHRRARVVIVKRSSYRPEKIVVYHPYWRPAYTYHRRWIFFPRYNLYWDNWRNHYLFWNGKAWISQSTAPAVIVNVNLDAERSVELPENEEDEDDIYKSNSSHKTKYTSE